MLLTVSTVTTMVVAPSPTLIRLQGIELQPCVGAHLLLCNRSAALLQLGRSNEALVDAVKALELSPPTFAKASHWELHTSGDRGHSSAAGAAAHAWQLCTYVHSFFPSAACTLESCAMCHCCPCAPCLFRPGSVRLILTMHVASTRKQATWPARPSRAAQSFLHCRNSRQGMA